MRSIHVSPAFVARLFCTLASSTLFATASFASTAAPALFAPAGVQAQADSSFVRDRQVVRARAVGIDFGVLTAAADARPGSNAAGQSISLNLFDDVSFVAEADHVERTERGMTWTGHLRGIDMSQVVLVMNGNVVAGNITMPMARYHVRFAGNGVHEVQRIDTARFPRDEASMPVPAHSVSNDAAAAKAPSPAPAGARDEDGSQIDVMVVYSAVTRVAAGGTQAMRSLIDLAVAETNQSYQNSGVAQRLRLVHTEEVDYKEKGDLEDALDCITSTSDGCLDHVHALRNAYGADLVSFWVEDGGDYCGLAWFMDKVSASFEEHGFSTAVRSCATGYYTFGHELGHNMGLRHDVYVDPGTTPYPYAHGYVNTWAVNPFRTIMAYNTACEDEWKNCTRLQYWSNPAVTNVFFPMGNATADDHTALNNTARTVANFRQAVSAPKAPYQGLWATANEDGWGVSVTQHGSTIVAGFHTYEASGYPVWYILSNCPLAGRSCSGDLYKLSGGRAPAAPWDGASVALSTVGRATLSFYDADNATLSYIVNGNSGYKYLGKQVFGTGAGAPAVDYSDLWWNPAESGWGVALTQQSGTISATWYAYDADGLPVWYSAPACTMAGQGCSADVYQATGGTPFTSVWNGSGLAKTAVGSVSFAFTDAGNGTMTYMINGVAGSRAISRLPF